MKLVKAICLVGLFSIILSGVTFAQDSKEELIKKIMDKVDKKLKEEEDRILGELKGILEKEFGVAKTEPDKPKPDKPKPPAKKGPGYLGITPGELDDEKKEELKFKGEGALIGEVISGSPAEKAGLKEDDIIMSVDDKDTPDFDKLKEIITTHKAGDTIKLKIWRDGKEAVIDITLGEKTKEEGPKTPPQPPHNESEDKDDKE